MAEEQSQLEPGGRGGAGRRVLAEETKALLRERLSIFRAFSSSWFVNVDVQHCQAIPVFHPIPYSCCQQVYTERFFVGLCIHIYVSLCVHVCVGVCVCVCV